MSWFFCAHVLESYLPCENPCAQVLESYLPCENSCAQVLCEARSNKFRVELLGLTFFSNKERVERVSGFKFLVVVTVVEC
jgi:hypothetical protein